MVLPSTKYLVPCTWYQVLATKYCRKKRKLFFSCWSSAGIKDWGRGWGGPRGPCPPPGPPGALRGPRGLPGPPGSMALFGPYLFCRKLGTGTAPTREKKCKLFSTVPGTKYLVPSTWYQVLGTKYLVPSPWYQVLGTRSLVPSPWTPWYQILGTKSVPSTWYQVLGTNYLVPDTYQIVGKRLNRNGLNKYLVPNTWYQALGTKSLVPSPWYQALGTKSLVPSTW